MLPRAMFLASKASTTTMIRTTQYFSRQYRSYFATTPGEDRRRAQHKAQKSQEETI